MTTALHADGRADVAEHLQRAIEAIRADHPPGANSSAERKDDEAPPFPPGHHRSCAVHAPRAFTQFLPVAAVAAAWPIPTPLIPAMIAGETRALTVPP